MTQHDGAPDEGARELRASLSLGSDPDSMRLAQLTRLRNARPRTKRALAVAFVAVIAIVVGALWLANSQPFIMDNAVALFGPEALSADGHREYRWKWSQGGKFAAGTWLHNNGPLPVEVVALSPYPSESPFVPWDNWRVSLGNREQTNGNDQPFRSFTLWPGDRQLFWIRGEYLRCPEQYAIGSGAGSGDVWATYRILGVIRHEKVDLGFAYSTVISFDCHEAPDNSNPSG